MVRMRLKLSKVLPYVLGAATATAFGAYLCGNLDRYRQLLSFSVELPLSLGCLALGTLALSGTTNYLVYRSLGARLAFGESFGLASVNTLANQLPFAGGLVAKGVYLKSEHNLAYPQFLSATGALYLCFIATNGVIGLVIISLLSFLKRDGLPVLLAVGFAAMTLVALLLKVPTVFRLFPAKWEHRLVHIVGGWQALSRNTTLLAELIGVQILMTAVTAGRFWIAFHALSQDVTYAQCLLFSSATVLTRLVSIAPGGLGVREGIVAGVAAVLGFEPGVSAVAVGLDRLVATAVIIALGTVYSYVLGKKATEREAVDADEA